MAEEQKRHQSALQKRSHEREKTMRTLLHSLNKQCEITSPVKKSSKSLIKGPYFNQSQSLLSSEVAPSHAYISNSPSKHFQQVINSSQTNIQADVQIFNNVAASEQDCQTNREQQQYSGYLLRRHEEKAMQVQSQTALNGRLFITAPKRKQSDSRFQLKDRGKLKMCRFEEHELEAISMSIAREQQDWQEICQSKQESCYQPYIESVGTFDLKFNKARELKERKASSRILDSSYQRQVPRATQSQSNFYSEGAQNRLKNFNKMNITELKQHERGILNLYEQHGLTKTVHNKEESGAGLFDIKLSAGEYDQIFDKPPSFQEKKAFVDVFRKKWREDKGYCSMFDKRASFKPSGQEKKGKRPQTAMVQHSLPRSRTAMSQQRLGVMKGSQGFKRSQESLINVNGTQAKFHKPIQNNDPENLNEFITHLYEKANGGAILRVESKETGVQQAQNESSNPTHQDRIIVDYSCIQQQNNSDSSFSQIRTKPSNKQVISLPQPAIFSHNNNPTMTHPYSIASPKDLNDYQAQQEGLGEEVDGKIQTQYLSNLILDNNTSGQVTGDNRISYGESQQSPLAAERLGNDSVYTNLNEVNRGGSQQVVEEGDKKPSIFTLPQNPMNQSHYKYNFLKNKLENNRLENIHLSQVLSLRLDGDRVRQNLDKHKMAHFDQQLTLMKGFYRSSSVTSNGGGKPQQRLTYNYVKHQKLLNKRNTSSTAQYDKKLQERRPGKNAASLGKQAQLNSMLKRPQTSEGLSRGLNFSVDQSRPASRVVKKEIKISQEACIKTQSTYSQGAAAALNTYNEMVKAGQQQESIEGINESIGEAGETVDKGGHSRSGSYPREHRF